MNDVNAPMYLKERLLHGLLFEMGAVILTAVVVLLFLPNKAATAITTGIAISLMAMLWNIIFNAGFDKIFTKPRQHRSFGLRLFHTASFEFGLLIFTIPMIAYLLNLSLWQALLADIGLTVLITVYALIFNWIYDNIRLKFIKVDTAQPITNQVSINR